MNMVTLYTAALYTLHRHVRAVVTFVEGDYRRAFVFTHTLETLPNWTPVDVGVVVNTPSAQRCPKDWSRIPISDSFVNGSVDLFNLDVISSPSPAFSFSFQLKGFWLPWVFLSRICSFIVSQSYLVHWICLLTFLFISYQWSFNQSVVCMLGCWVFGFVHQNSYWLSLLSFFY